MRSKAEIEHQLAHMKTDCAAAPEVNAVWIEALEWVLGDEAHKAAYDRWFRHIDVTAEDSVMSPHELIVRLLMALERLR